MGWSLAGSNPPPSRSDAVNASLSELDDPVDVVNEAARSTEAESWTGWPLSEEEDAMKKDE